MNDINDYCNLFIIKELQIIILHMIFRGPDSEAGVHDKLKKVKIILDKIKIKNYISY